MAQGLNLLLVERLGGLAGFGGVNARVRSRGQLSLPELSEVQHHALDQLFVARADPANAQVRDGFRYRISRSTSEGEVVVELPEAMVPSWLTACVKDEWVT